MTNRSRLLLFAICLLAVGLTATAARADSYNYTFSGVADLTSGNTENIAFQYTTSSPITSFTSVSESQLNYCTNCQTSPLPVLSFLPGSILGDSLVFDDLNGVGSYLFAAGAFSSPGTYTSAGPYDIGSLSVTTTVAVPEPSTIELGLFGCMFIGLLGFTRRRTALANRAASLSFN